MMLVLSAVAPGLRTMMFSGHPLALSDARIPAAKDSSTASTAITTATTVNVSNVLSLRTKRLRMLYRNGSAITNSLQTPQGRHHMQPQSEPRWPQRRDHSDCQADRHADSADLRANVQVLN